MIYQPRKRITRCHVTQEIVLLDHMIEERDAVTDDMEMLKYWKC